MAYEIPMRHKFITGSVQLMGASKMDASRRPKSNNHVKVLPETK
jgi:hypothetical protein